MDEDKSLDLLDLDDTSMDVLPDAAPFAAPRPKKPWLLLVVGVLVIVLATYIIIRTIAGDSSTSIDVDLDAPAVIVDGVDAPSVDINPNPQPVAVEPVAQPKVNQEKNVVEKPEVVKPVQVQPQTPGVPVRVVEDRKEVTFNPDKPAVQPKKVAPQVKKQAPKPVAKKTTPKKQNAIAGGWYVQFGSYSSRSQAENAERQIRAAHSGLFNGKQFVILAAQLPNGTTTYRLRIAFASAADANGFCRNAKSDGLDCYVAK